MNCPLTSKFNVALVDTVIRRTFQGLAPNTHFGITYDELQIRRSSTFQYKYVFQIQIRISNTNTLQFFYSNTIQIGLCICYIFGCISKYDKITNQISNTNICTFVASLYIGVNLAIFMLAQCV